MKHDPRALRNRVFAWMAEEFHPARMHRKSRQISLNPGGVASVA